MGWFRKMSFEKTPNNHINEYLISKEEDSNIRLSRELLSGAKDENDLDFKTDLSPAEITYITQLHYNDLVLQRLGFKPLYNDFLNKYKRLVISKNRLSRKEVIDSVKTQDNTDEVLSKMGNLSSITGSKK